MSRRLMVGLIVVILAAAGAYAVYSNNNSKPASATQANVQTAQVTRGNLLATVNSAGPVAARAQLMLNFGQAGTVKQVYVKLGDRVKQGQVLAELDSTDLQFALASSQTSFNSAQINFNKAVAGPSATDLVVAQAQVDSAQAGYDAAVRKAGVNDAQLVVARSGVDSATVSVQKAQADYDKAVANGVSDLTALAAALQQAKDNLKVAQAQYTVQLASLDNSAVRSAASALSQAKDNLVKLQSSPSQDDLKIAQAQLDQAKLTYQQAQAKLAAVQIVAPFDGTITQVNVDTFYAASPTSNAIQISDLGTLQVTVQMAEVDIERVKVGQDASITMDALPDRPTLAGKVDQVALSGVTTQGVVNYPVVIKLINPDSSVIKTGMTANVGVTVDERDNVLIAPSRALRTVGKQRVANVLVAGGLTKQVAVQVGLTNDTQSEIISGLNEGDQLVISGATATTPGGGGGFRLPFLGGR